MAANSLRFRKWPRMDWQSTEGEQEMATQMSADALRFADRRGFRLFTFYVLLSHLLRRRQAPTFPTFYRAEGATHASSFLIATLRRPIEVASHMRSGTHLMIDLLRRQFADCGSWKWPGERNDMLYLPLDALTQPTAAWNESRALGCFAGRSAPSSRPTGPFPRSKPPRPPTGPRRLDRLRRHLPPCREKSLHRPRLAMGLGLLHPPGRSRSNRSRSRVGRGHHLLLGPPLPIWSQRNNTIRFRYEDSVGNPRAPSNAFPMPSANPPSSAAAPPRKLRAHGIHAGIALPPSGRIPPKSSHRRRDGSFGALHRARHRSREPDRGGLHWELGYAFPEGESAPDRAPAATSATYRSIVKPPRDLRGNEPFQTEQQPNFS